MNIRIGQQLLSLETPLVMGILNITPDSFHDGGRFTSMDDALKQTEKMLLEGAAIIDIGGQSTRPGAEMINEEEELKRVLPIIAGINKSFPEAVLSIDTFRATVAAEAVAAGANIVNDISAGDEDPLMFETIAKLRVPYILMHKKGSPETMQQNPSYENVLLEVFDYLAKKTTELRKLGVADLIIDPGFGFGKSVEHNYTLLAHLKEFKLLGFPILAGVSRKSMINKVLGISAEKALNGTTVLNTMALMNGASILRVHDVEEAVEAVRLVGQLTTNN